MSILRLYTLAFAIGLGMGLTVPGHAEPGHRPAGPATAQSARPTAAGGAGRESQNAAGPKGESSTARAAPSSSARSRASPSRGARPGPESGEPATLSQVQAEKLAGEMVARRDEALASGNRGQLESLTTEASSARAYDMAIFEQTQGRIRALETEVESVSVRGAMTIEVWTVQRSLVLDDGAEFGQAGRRCTRWKLESDPWRIVETGQCEPGWRGQDAPGRTRPHAGQAPAR